MIALSHAHAGFRLYHDCLRGGFIENRIPPDSIRFDPVRFDPMRSDLIRSHSIPLDPIRFHPIDVILSI